MRCFQGPRGLRGLQGPMGAVGDRVSDFWNAATIMIKVQMCHSCVHRASVSLCPQGLPGFRGKSGIAGIIGKTVSLFLFVKHRKNTTWWRTAARRELVPSMNSCVCFI